MAQEIKEGKTYRVQYENGFARVGIAVLVETEFMLQTEESLVDPRFGEAQHVSALATWYDAIDGAEPVECTEDLYNHARDVVPPILRSCMFGVGEAQSHNNDGSANRHWFCTIRRRYFCCLGTLGEAARSFANLRVEEAGTVRWLLAVTT